MAGSDLPIVGNSGAEAEVAVQRTNTDLVGEYSRQQENATENREQDFHHAMRTKDILGRVLAALRGVWIEDPQLESCWEMFLIGHTPYKWWLTKSGAWACRDVVRTLLNGRSGFEAPDEQTLIDNFKAVLKSRIERRDGFDVRKAENGATPKTLFDSINQNDKKTLAVNIYEEFIATSGALRHSYLTLYPLQKVDFTGFIRIGNDLCVASSDATELWNELTKEYPGLANLDKVSGKFQAALRGVGARNPPSCWLVHKSRSTQAGAAVRASREMREFIGLLSAITGLFGESHAKSGADEENASLQFDDEGGIHGGYFDQILPPLLTSWNLAEHIPKISKWYSDKSAASPDQLGRSRAAAIFCHRALCADEFGRFVSLFIAVDAIFGERGKVEQNILEGVGRLYPDPSWRSRTAWLFDLRSAIVHGECAELEDWPKILEYEAAFDSKPPADIETLAFTALTKCFSGGA